MCRFLCVSVGFIAQAAVMSVFTSLSLHLIICFVLIRRTSIKFNFLQNHLSISLNVGVLSCRTIYTFRQ